MGLLEQIISALERRETVILTTIVRTIGSTPAPALSRMLVSPAGMVLAGSVGGGCIENDIREAAVQVGRAGQPRFLSFGFHEEHAEIGPVCGGSIDLLIEPLTQAELPIYRSLRRTIDEGVDAVIFTRFDREGNRVSKNVLTGLENDRALVREMAEAGVDLGALMKESVLHAQGLRQPIRDGEILLEPFSSWPELVIFGGGHVGRAISRAAALAGFRVTIVDDRESFANAERFPEAERIIVTPFDRISDTVPIRPSSYLIIVTRAHQYDEIVLEQVLQKAAHYVGMIGSKRKVALTYEHLRDRGISVEELSRVYAPIGIDIGAATIEEIGISVVAELIHVRRKASGPLRHLKLPASF